MCVCVLQVPSEALDSTASGHIPGTVSSDTHAHETPTKATTTSALDATLPAASEDAAAQQPAPSAATMLTFDTSSPERMTSPMLAQTGDLPASDAAGVSETAGASGDGNGDNAKPHSD